jgi:hypothetical protein
MRGQDPAVLARTLVQVRVEDRRLPGLPGTVPTLDLFDTAVDDARRLLLDQADRALAAGQSGPRDAAAGATLPLPGPTTLTPPRLAQAPVAPRFPASTASADVSRLLEEPIPDAAAASTATGAPTDRAVVGRGRGTPRDRRAAPPAGRGRRGRIAWIASTLGVVLAAAVSLLLLAPDVLAGGGHPTPVTDPSATVTTIGQAAGTVTSTAAPSTPAPSATVTTPVGSSGPGQAAPRTSSPTHRSTAASTSHPPGAPAAGDSNSSCTPQITRVDPFVAAKTQRVEITGSCFGWSGALSAEDVTFFQIKNVTQGWSACYSGDSPENFVTCNVSSWTNGEIVFQGFADENNGGYQLYPDDQIEILVRNAQNGHGPVSAFVRVGGASGGSTP